MRENEAKDQRVPIVAQENVSKVYNIECSIPEPESWRMNRYGSIWMGKRRIE
jgi:hypothetical protein